jgi:predicted NBD/HSP70 family sugar kinase
MNFERRSGGNDAAGDAGLSRGSSQSGVRLYNERLVLSLIRRHGSLPKAEIARLTGLSAQTVSIIVRQLEAEKLLIKQKPQRGKVGQPLTPFSLNPDGAYAIGLKVGRRSCNLVTLDLAGKIRTRHTEVYHYPSPKDILTIAAEGLHRLSLELDREQRKRIAGLGIAAPFEMWNWEQEAGAPQKVMQAWRGFDFAGEIAKLSRWPVLFCNDATAACAAELFFGKGQSYRDFAYFYVGFFVGGGVVINGSLFQGRTGYAGAFGPLPVPTPQGTEQLIRHASLYVLERMLAEDGRDPLRLARIPEGWKDLGPSLDRWISETAANLAYAALAAASVIDFESIIIDGAMPETVRARLVAETLLHFEKLDRRGIAPLTIVEGSIGADARAMGGAALSLLANFAIDRDVLFKESL